MLTEDEICILLTAAGHAPSMHNPHPWRFEVQGPVIDVLLDKDRMLPAEDVPGRAAHIGVGTAVFNLQVAAPGPARPTARPHRRAECRPPMAADSNPDRLPRPTRVIRPVVRKRRRTMSTHPAPIVVGYDGSTGSEDALRWSTAEAIRTMAPLRIVEAFEPVIVSRPSPGRVVPLEALRTTRQRRLDAVAEDVRLHHPDLRVDTSLVGGAASKVLVEAAEDARLVVLGSRGLGGWSGLLVGSVAVQVTTHAHCPVVVIPKDLRPHAQEAPTVVVGVDGSKASATAIDFAFDHAEALHAQVVAVHAWTSPFLTYANGASMLQFDEEKIREESRLLVAESVAGAAADHPDVEWTTELVPGSAAQALVRRSESADLLVVGSRGRGGFTGLLLGSVSQSVLHHTHCPIAIAR